MNESFSKITEGCKEIPIPYGPPFAGLLSDPQMTMAYWKSTIKEMEMNLKRNGENIKNAISSIIDQKIDNYYKIHGVRANIIVLASYYKHFFPWLDYREIPIIYSLNLKTKEELSSDSIQVF